MSEYYIANRLSHSEMNKIVPGVSRLNRRLAESLATVALQQGTAKTKNGRRLEFYSVNNEQLQNLLDPATATLVMLKNNIDWQPLLTVDAEVMTRNLREVNARYTRSMDRATHKKYLAELATALTAAVVRVGEDKKNVRQTWTNPGLKVGDFITHHEHRVTFPAVITKITDAGYQYQCYVLDGVYTLRSDNVDQCLQQFKNARGWGNAYDGSVTVPFKDNMDHFTLHTKKINRRWTRYSAAMIASDNVSYTESWYQD